MTRYELTERIGVGAIAEIFRGKAIAVGGFEKPVAIKRILPQLSEDRHFVELLIAEANIVSHLCHRNIVQVFDVGKGPDGQFFVVLEFVDGADLRILQAGLEAEGKRLPIDLGIYIGAEICEALEYAHRAPGPDGQPLRLVHRDVAPSNVLLSRSGEAKLTDFGIAKRAEEATVHVGVRGKYAYISPEQAYSRPVDARSDVYSVGILLFELLLGKRLFSRMADFDALNAVREGKVPRPRSVDPGLDPRLEAILLKALAHDPDQRFSGAGELGQELRSFRYSMPATGSDPALELASAVDYYGEKGRLSRAQAAAGGDGPSTSSSFTITRRESLVRNESFAQARQVLESLEEDDAQEAAAVMAGDSAELEALLGAEPLVSDVEADEEADEDHDVAEEETRIVHDPFLTAGINPPQRRSAPQAAARPSGSQAAARPSGSQAVARPPTPAPSAPPETLLHIEPVPLPPVSPVSSVSSQPAAAQEPARTMRGRDGVERPMAGSAREPLFAVRHTGAVPKRRRPSTLLRGAVILLVAGGLVAAVLLEKDRLLRLADDVMSRVMGSGTNAIVPDAAPPDAAVPDAAPPDAAPPDAAPPDAAVPDAAAVDAAPPDAAAPEKKKRRKRRRGRRR